MTTYTRSGPEQRALVAALKCPQDHPLHRVALRIIKRALRAYTKQQAAAELGMAGSRLSELLREHPELSTENIPGETILSAETLTMTTLTGEPVRIVGNRPIWINGCRYTELVIEPTKGGSVARRPRLHTER